MGTMSALGGLKEGDPELKASFSNNSETLSTERKRQALYFITYREPHPKGRVAESSRESSGISSRAETDRMAMLHAELHLELFT